MNPTTMSDWETAMTGTLARDFGGVTYAVTGLPTADGGEVLYSLQDMARAERAIALAALTDGRRDPAALRFARKSMGYTRAGFAASMDVALFTVEVCEDGREAVAPEMVGRIIGLLTQSDRGGFVAQRVL